MPRAANGRKPTCSATTGRATYRWQVDGDDVLIVRVAGGDPATRRRLRVTFLDADTYRVTIETSPADADAWTAGLVTMTRRLAAAP